MELRSRKFLCFPHYIQYLTLFSRFLFSLFVPVRLNMVNSFHVTHYASGSEILSRLDLFLCVMRSVKEVPIAITQS
jgi:hypothetical protein